MIERAPNQICLQGCKPFKSFDEAHRPMAREDLKHADLLNITEATFLNYMNGLIINFRKTETHEIHATGTRVENFQINY